MHAPNEKLEHYLALAASATGPAAADLVVRATADPGLHVFSELLASPNIAALVADPATTPHHALLLLFAHGTYADYAASAASYPPLTPAHLEKLRALSLLSLARGRTSIPYSLLSSALSLPSNRELEQLVLDVGSSGLLSARLDQRASRVLVTAPAPRDVDVREGAADIGDLVAVLGAWRESSSRLLGVIDRQIAYVNAETVRKRAEKQSREDAQLATRETVTGASGGKRPLPMPPSGFGGAGEEEAAGRGDSFGVAAMGPGEVGDMLEPIDAELRGPGRRVDRRPSGARSTRSRFLA